ncbi:MAG: 30S ribosomal protein S16 [Melioribacteraceae bacterium]
MAVKLRLKRMGKKKQPIYKVVAADSRSPRDGKFIEAIGLYNPKTEPATIEIKESRAMYWLNVGAQPTVTVKNLLSGQGIILRRELLKKGLKEEEIAVKLDEWKKLTEANLAAKLKKKADKKSKKAIAKEKSQGATGA